MNQMVLKTIWTTMSLANIHFRTNTFQSAVNLYKVTLICYHLFHHLYYIIHNTLSLQEWFLQMITLLLEEETLFRVTTGTNWFFQNQVKAKNQAGVWIFIYPRMFNFLCHVLKKNFNFLSLYVLIKNVV